MKIPELKEWIQALILDLICMFLFAYIATIYFDGTEVSATTRKFTFFLIFIFYEPIFVAAFGGSLGHRALGLRVKRESNFSKNVFLPFALFRVVVKGFLGIFSLLTVSINSKGKAIHDMLSLSVVLYKSELIRLEKEGTIEQLEEQVEKIN